MYQRSIDEKEWENITEKEVTKQIKAHCPTTVKYVIRELKEYHITHRPVTLGLYSYRFIED